MVFYSLYGKHIIGSLCGGHTYKSLVSRTQKFRCAFRFHSKMCLNSHLKGTWSLFIAFAPQNRFRITRRLNAKKSWNQFP